MAYYGESPGETAMREVRAMTIMENEHKRRLWEEAFYRYVRDHFEPWQRRLLRSLQYMRVCGDWPTKDLPDGSEC